jgi:hypothetical protein
MLPLLSCLSLLSFAVVVSQPLFFWMALDRATHALSARAYAELRQQINAAIVKRLLMTYLVSLLLLLALLAMALLRGRSSLALGAGVAALTLIADLALAAKLNVPINKRMDGWNVDALPADWTQQRDAWSAALRVRCLVLLSGFVALACGLQGLFGA